MLPNLSEGDHKDLADKINAMSSRNMMKNISHKELNEKLSHPKHANLREFFQKLNIVQENDVGNDEYAKNQGQETGQEQIPRHTLARSPSISPPPTDQESEMFEREPRSPDIEPPLSIPDMSSSSLMKGSDNFELPEYLLPHEQREKLEVRKQKLEIEPKIEELKDDEGYFRPLTPEPQAAVSSWVPKADFDQHDRGVIPMQDRLWKERIPHRLALRSLNPSSSTLIASFEYNSPRAIDLESCRYYEKRLKEVEAELDEFEKEHGYDRKRGSYYNPQTDEAGSLSNDRTRHDACPGGTQR
eukprot:758317-Hanusia_phi.AAC.4